VDAGAIRELFADENDLRLAWPTADYPFNPDQWMARLDPSGGNESYLFDADSGPVAHIALLDGVVNREMRIGLIVVRQDVRGRGIAFAMLREVEELLSSRNGIDVMTLNVKRFNVGAWSVYSRFGFVEHSSNGDTVHMKKRLPL